MSEIKFRRDTGFRSLLFTADSFAHPAKMDAQLLIWVVERYTKVGEIVLDPMFGIGTTILACSIGRNVIGIELEQKFVDMAKANWDKVRMMPQLGYEMGTCQIIQGDARRLEGLLVDGIITSPPYANQVYGGKCGIDWSKGKGGRDKSKELAYKPEANFSSNILSYGESRDQIGNFPYGSIDSVITSPPYDEGTGHGRGSKASNEILETKKLYLHGVGSYGDSEGNIGNLKGDTYLSAMLQVYQQCYKVLKPEGLMILVTKNFIRNKEEVRLDEDTIKLCEQAGFDFLERHYRKIHTQSFWRTIYQQRYPDAPVLDKEDILVFRRELV